VREGDRGRPLPKLEAEAGALGMPVYALCAALEREISVLDPAERGDFLKELGIAEAAQDRLVRGVYELLNLISFLTAGEDEVRAWTCERGTLAPRAAGKVHSDIERGFIRAEVVAYADFVAAGSSMAQAKKAGKVRLEGKEYVVQDGDIINFRFNV
jgi:ribosome-binding ATPase YchF (GTP1/OBG family)